MRVVLPDRVPMLPAVSVAAVIFALQLAEHTDFFFALLTFGFLVISCLAFNVAGGFSRVFGGYIFWFSLMTVLLGVVFKIIYIQPGDSYLYSPNVTMTAYFIGACGLLAVAAALNVIDLRAHSFAQLAEPPNLNFNTAALGCAIFGGSIIVASSIFPNTPGSPIALLIQLNILPILAIILGTAAVIRGTNGRRTFGLVNTLAMLYTLFISFIGYSKEGLLTPLLCWLMAAAYTRLQLRVVHYIGLTIAVTVGVTLVPLWANFGRNNVVENPDFSTRVAAAFINLQHFNELSQQSSSVAEGRRDSFDTGYFGGNFGLQERLTMISADDSLINLTERGVVEGYLPVYFQLVNVIPHFIYPNKPATIGGNYYAHEMGSIPANDFTTGISFSPVGEAYHLGKFFALFLVLPLIWLTGFAVTELVVGDIQKHIWGLLLLARFAHFAPESGASGLIYLVGQGPITMLFGIIVCCQLSPIVGTAILGRDSGVRQSPQPSPAR